MKLWLRKERPSTDGVVNGDVEGMSASLRARGDAARGRRAWDEAASLYRQHVTIKPDDFAIWIQLGHALKEDGLLAEAEDAYRRALALNSSDADLYLQIGHLHKLIGNNQRAASSYSRALKLNARSPAYQELLTLNRRAQADAILGSSNTLDVGPVVYLQINDLLHFLRHNKSVSGIQRVQVGFIEYCLGMARGGDLHVQFVFNRDDEPRLWGAADTVLIEVVEYLAGNEVDQIQLTEFISRIEGMATPIRITAKDTVIILGAFWGIDGNTRLLAALKNAGAKVGMYIYDLIPITHPEFCSQHLANDFTVDICEALNLIDFALTISDYTKRELKAFIEKLSFPSIPVETVPLAHKLTGMLSDESAESPFSIDLHQGLSALRGKEYVLCVCTIEPRKNHRYLFEVWKLLKSTGTLLPKLVFVGRKGWHTEDFMAQIENTANLEGSLILLHDLSDAELATLYDNCLFTTFPSLVEGWGLPIGESLSHGKLCVASNQTSMPEVGGPLAEYVDPFNVRDGVEIFSRLLSNRSLIADWEKRIASEFKPRTWQDVCSDFFKKVDSLKDDGGSVSHSPYGKLHSGRLLKISSLQRGKRIPSNYDFHSLSRLVLPYQFYPPENLGAWLKDRKANFEFSTIYSEQTEILVYLKFIIPPNIHHIDVILRSSDGSELPFSLNSGLPSSVRLPMKINESGIASFEIEVLSAYDEEFHAPRNFCMGLSAIGFAHVSDLHGRLEILEGLTDLIQIL